MNDSKHQENYSGPSQSTVTVVPDHLEQKDGLEQATKHDNGKPMLSLFPVRALIAINEVFTYGAKKYDVGNWHRGEGFDWARLSDAALRHHYAWLLGEDLDPESKFHHLAHLGCCNAMLLEHVLTGHGKDTRDRMQYIK